MRRRRDGLRPLGTLFNLGTLREMTDGQLLERFATGRGESADLAFAALVERHGGMVLRVCRARLGHSHDAQDAFQATFLVLIEKARGLWVRDSLGPWLHQVAVRTASCARASAMRRRRREGGPIAIAEEPARPEIGDWEQALHDEIDRLPESYRVPIILCDLEGHSNEEAARQMGRPVGTVRSWRSRGREKLRDRLIRRGIAPSTALAFAGRAARSAAFDEGAATASRSLAERVTAGEVSASVRVLVQGVSKAMLLGKIRTMAAASIGMVALAAGLGMVVSGLAQDDQGEKEATPRPPEATRSAPQTALNGDTPWGLTLRDVIFIGLNNFEGVGVIEQPTREASMVIVARGGDVDEYRFQSEIMAYVRSIEQQYWALSTMIVQQSSAETAVKRSEAILKGEQAKAQDEADRREGREQLERFRLDLINKDHNLLMIERDLRALIGLPRADGRRIVPATPPVEARLEPDFEASKAIMLEKQPDLARSRQAMGDLAEIQPAEFGRRKATHEQILHDATHSLCRHLLEIGSNHKHFTTSSRLREAAKHRLDDQKALYEKGDGKLDRYLDAVNRYYTGVAQQADYRSRYNASIAAFEEAKGTLLEHEKILVATKKTEEVGRLADRAKNAGMLPIQIQPRPLPIPHPMKVPAPEPGPSGTTYAFGMSIRIGDRPVEIRATFTVGPASANGPPRIP